MRILLITIIMTLSSCMVSQKSFEDKCCKIESEIEELKSRCNGMDLKEQILRQAIEDLQDKQELKPPHDPANE
tara:strand:+ start:352 stop:570 length:219 start_codon:yes stop_codon:yes gene_type:complete